MNRIEIHIPERANNGQFKALNHYFTTLELKYPGILICLYEGLFPEVRTFGGASEKQVKYILETNKLND